MPFSRATMELPACTPSVVLIDEHGHRHRLCTTWHQVRYSHMERHTLQEHVDVENCSTIARLALGEIIAEYRERLDTKHQRKPFWLRKFTKSDADPKYITLIEITRLKVDGPVQAVFHQVNAMTGDFRVFADKADLRRLGVVDPYMQAPNSD